MTYVSTVISGNVLAGKAGYVVNESTGSIIIFLSTHTEEVSHTKLTLFADRVSSLNKVSLRLA